jgi:hypothetical protein
VFGRLRVNVSLILQAARESGEGLDNEDSSSNIPVLANLQQRMNLSLENVADDFLRYG